MDGVKVDDINEQGIDLRLRQLNSSLIKIWFISTTPIGSVQELISANLSIPTILLPVHPDFLWHFAHEIGPVSLPSAFIFL